MDVNMNMNLDVLKSLYANTVKTGSTNTNGLNTNNGSAGIINNQSAFLKILTDTLLGGSTETASDLLTGSNKGNGNTETQSSDLLSSLLMMMQQGALNQNMYLDGNNLLSNLGNVGNVNADSLNNLMLGINSAVGNAYTNVYDSTGNMEALLLGLQNQALLKSTESPTIPVEGMETVTTAQAAAVTQASGENLFAGRSFPKEVMESINAVRQARDNIRSGIEQIKSIAGTNTADVNVNIVNVLAQSADGKQDLKITLIDGGAVQNAKPNIKNSSENSTVQIPNIKNSSENSTVQIPNNKSAAVTLENSNQLNAQLRPIEALKTEGLSAESLSTENAVGLSDKNDKNNNLISEELLTVNGADIAKNSKIIKVNDESSIIRESVMTQIKDQMMQMKADGKQTVTMQLTPENLGKLDIKMVFENGNLSVEIMASNSKTHSLILSNISELKSVLQNSIADRSFMNADNQKQMYEQNHNQNNQNNQGYSQQQEKNDGNGKNERDYQPIYTEVPKDGDEIDFLTELTRLKNFRF